MQSLKSKLVIGMIRNRHFLSGRLRPEVVDETFSVERFRDGVDRISARMKLPRDVRVEKADIPDMEAEWILPATPEPGKAMFYIHGGGFISGSCMTHRPHVAKFARESGLRALLFDYRLAPEHPFPAAVDDCVRAYEWLLEQGYGPDDVIVGGESAGGTLTLSLLLVLKERGSPLPCAAFSISPVTDLRCRAESFRRNAKLDIAPEGASEHWTGLYIGDADPTQPLLSPQFGDLSGLPPLFICVGDHEIHLDDCLAVARSAEEKGVDVTLRVWPGMVHAFPVMAPLFREASEALSEICAFARNHVTRTTDP